MAKHAKVGTDGKSVCQEIMFCTGCSTVVDLRKRKGQPHICGERYCKICRKTVNSGHLCFIQTSQVPEFLKTIIQPTANTATVIDIANGSEVTVLPEQPQTAAAPAPPTRDKEPLFIYIFFDIETMQSTPYKDCPTRKEHIANLVMTQQVCNVCIYMDLDIILCTSCGVRKNIYYGERALDNFISYVLQAWNCKNITVIAHNFAGFDGQLVLKRIVDEKRATPQLIMNGMKIMTMQIGHVHFKDSLLFMPLALAKLPGVFGFSEQRKGYFPHLANTPEMQNYVGPLPPVEDFDVDGMSSSNRLKFLEWHSEEKARVGDSYCLKDELIGYCASDVRILATACIRFHNLFVTQNRVAPFSECVTLAHACMTTYRRVYLRPQSIGVIPGMGYRRDRQSKKALQWLGYIDSTLGVNNAGQKYKLQYQGNGDEKRVGPFKIDGFYQSDDGVQHIYEFNGCFFHGCLKCQRGRTTPIDEDHNSTMALRYQSTMTRQKKLEALGDVNVIWECDFDLKLKTDQVLREYMQSVPAVIDALDPRDSLTGGRTEGFTLYKERGEGEQIHYIDVTSLYPYVLKNGLFPIGHPKIHTVRFPHIAAVHGLVKCTILPPRHLYMPLLPARINGKLVFTLCRTCASEMQADCDHTDTQRALIGTWVVLEVRAALDEGYVILDMFEMWEYDVMQGNTASGDPGLFDAYVNNFLRLKQQASGYPSHCTSEAERDAYIKNYLDHEGIQMIKSDIAPNPGLRTLSKLALNNLWGRMAMNPRRSHVEIVTEVNRFWELLTDPSIEVTTFLPVNDSTVYIGSRPHKDAPVTHGSSNVVVGSFVTAQARLKLYAYLKQLGERVLYCDTDSIIYVSRPGEALIKCGDYLGEMTSELTEYGPNATIALFCSAGPKSYGYLVNCPDTMREWVVVKVKGITLNYRASQIITLEMLSNMVLGKGPDMCAVIEPRKIMRLKDHTLVSGESTKSFQVVFTKRHRLPNSPRTVPFGYVQAAGEQPEVS